MQTFLFSKHGVTLASAISPLLNLLYELLSLDNGAVRGIRRSVRMHSIGAYETILSGEIFGFEQLGSNSTTYLMRIVLQSVGMEPIRAIPESL